MTKTGYFFHSDCSLHDMGAGHPECPERLAAIERRLQTQGLAMMLDRREAPQAPIADLELAHGRMHIAALRGLTDGLRDEVQAGGPIRGTLKHSEKLGNETFAYVDAGALGEITARMDGTLPLDPGNPIELAFAPEHLYRFAADGKSL